MNDLKRELHNLCINYVQNRIDTVKQAIKATQQQLTKKLKAVQAINTKQEGP